MTLTKIVGCLVVASAAIISKPISGASYVPEISLTKIVETDYKLKRERDCIIEALYHEARGESEQGIHAVLSVIHNRIESSKFKVNSFCKVVSQPKQFSYRNHLDKNTSIRVKWKPIEKLKQQYIVDLANKSVLGMFQSDFKQKFLWYYTVDTRKSWASKLKSVRIGNHLFFYEA